MGCLGYLMDNNSKSKRNQPDEATIAAPYIAALKRKIDELCVKREQAPPLICANGGNVCKNPCYEYQQKIETQCPKCGGEVTKDFENGKTEKEEWDRNKGMYVKRTYYDDNICTEFNWTDDYKAIDVYLDNFFEFFTRRENKPDGSFVEYMVVDGERFDAPPNKNFMFFFWKNNMELFPSKSKGEIYDTVYKKDYLKIVKKAAGSPIKHKTPSYIKYSFYKIPYKVYTAEFSGILDFYGKNKKLPKYSLFTNSEFKKVSKSSKYTFYLTTDNIAGKKSDLKMLKRLAKTLKSKGYEAVIVGIGPNIHYVAYRYGCTGKKSVLLACFGGVDVGCIEEWTGDLGSSNTFQKNYDGAHILGLWYTKPYGSSSNIHKPIGRAWDANYGFALKNPAKYMAKHNISYIQTGTVTSACNRLKAGKMGGPKLIK